MVCKIQELCTVPCLDAKINISWPFPCLLFPLEPPWRFLTLIWVRFLRFVIFLVCLRRFCWFRHDAPLNLRVETYFRYDLGTTHIHTILSFHINSQPILAQSLGFRFLLNCCSNILDTFLYNCCSERQCHAFSRDVGRIWMSPTLSLKFCLENAN